MAIESGVTKCRCDSTIAKCQVLYPSLSHLDEFPEGLSPAGPLSVRLSCCSLKWGTALGKHFDLGCKVLSVWDIETEFMLDPSAQLYQ